MNHLLKTIILLLFPLHLAAQIPNWYLPASRNMNYPTNKWFIGYVEGKQQNGETFEDASARLKNDARVELISTIRTSIEHTMDSYSQSDLQQNSLDFNEQIREVNTTVTRITSNINDISGLNIQLYHDQTAGIIAAFAYANKDNLIQSYSNQLQVSYSKIYSDIIVANYLLSNEQLIQARIELEKAQRELSISDEILAYLHILGCDKNTINSYLKQRMDLRQSLEENLTKSSSRIKIYLQCEGNLFDVPFTSMIDEIKSQVSKLSCSFVNIQEQADWIINLKLQAKIDDIIGNSTDDFITIDVSGVVLDVKKQKSYNIYDSERESASKKNGGYKLAAMKILNGRRFTESISNDIIKTLKSK